MTQVWLVTGWFGADEWVESVHSTEALAWDACAALNRERTGRRMPREGLAGLCKFGVERWTVDEEEEA